MALQNCYYIITYHGIGGAEKRFIELCSYLQKNERRFDFYMIIPEQLLASVKENEEIYKLLQPWENKVITYDIDMYGPILQFQKELYGFICRHTTSNDILHFVITFPSFVFPLKHKKVIYSLTESSLQNVNFKGKTIYLLNVLRAKYIDVLDPGVYKKMSNYFFFKKKSISLTPGSFVDTTVFKPADNYQKENWFVFLGRFFFVKQIVELLRTVPQLCKKLDASGIKNYKFIFLGYGQLEPEIQSIMSLPEYQGLPVEIKKTNEPETILAKSKVFFSLQLRNNYPSKSLLERMAAGNIPLVTDVGATRIAAAPEFSYYVPEYFTATDIAGQLMSILNLDESGLKCKMEAARNFVINNFTIQASAEYYSGMYLKLSL
jgi:glycosyltransferase involved in cell wall biosynthesis